MARSTPPTLGHKAGLAFSRIGAYMSAYGPVAGAVRAAEHFLKFRCRPALRVATTKTPRGRIVHLRARTSDLSIFREIFIDSQYDIHGTVAERIIGERYEHLLRRGLTPLIVDAGGNIGLASVYFADLYPQAEIVLVEMSGDNIALAERNTGDLNVRCLRKAAWPSASDLVIQPAAHFSTLRVESVPPSTAHAGTALTPTDRHVGGVTLDEIVGDKGENLLLVKMDVEGSEAEIFLGRNAWLDHHPALFVEPHDEFFEACRSLPGLMRRPAYQNARVVLRGATIIFVPDAAPGRPRSFLDAR